MPVKPDPSPINALPVTEPVTAKLPPILTFPACVRLPLFVIPPLADNSIDLTLISVLPDDNQLTTVCQLVFQSDPVMTLLTYVIKSCILGSAIILSPLT